MMGQRLQEAHTRLKELSTEEVELRVAHTVLRLITQSGRKIEEGVVVDFPITQQDIAEASGTTLHTVSRILSGWESAGLVSVERRKIVVRDVQGLSALAERGIAEGRDTQPPSH
jgi:CRP-like cAMP-binding protein